MQTKKIAEFLKILLCQKLLALLHGKINKFSYFLEQIPFALCITNRDTKVPLRSSAVKLVFLGRTHLIVAI